MDLIQRLKERIRQAPSTDLNCVPPIVPRHAATLDDIKRAELSLGFKIPSLLRSLYVDVADGGYGPGYGIQPLHEIVEWHQICRVNWEGIYPPPSWPPSLIRFCEWGCNFWSGVDCSSERCVVFRFNPDEPTREIADMLEPECDSLSEWLTSW